MAELQFRLEKDTSTGRIHKRYADEYGRFELTRERCQRDQSGEYAVLRVAGGRADRGDGVPIGTPDEDLCKWDFPHLGEDTV